MDTSQQPGASRVFCHVSSRQRFAAAIVFAVVAGAAVLLRLAATGHIDIERWLTPCGIKQRYGLPCPTCGWTTAALTYSQGYIGKAFVIQPAAALVYSAAAVLAFYMLFVALTGRELTSAKRLWMRIRNWHVIAVVLLVILMGWAVMLARAGWGSQS
jgi:hypothetical protein